MKKKRLAGCVATCFVVIQALGIGTQVFANTIEDSNMQKTYKTVQVETKPSDAENDFNTPDELPEVTPEQSPDELPDTEMGESQYEHDQRVWEKAQLSNTYIKRAKNTSIQVKLKKIPQSTSNYSISWTTNRKSIATVDNNGIITAKKEGVAKITCTIRMESGYEKVFTCEVEVTNPKFAKSTYIVAKGVKLQTTFTGTTTVDYKMYTSNEELLKVYKKDKGVVRGLKAGTVKLYAEVDGKKIECKIIITNPKVKKDLFVFTKSQTGSIQVSNLTKNSKVTYTSTNPQVATVSKSGKITAKKLGVAVVKVVADQKEFEITVSVGREKAVTAIRNAQKALGSKYSQKYRMRRGYYDCSSLVWRCYVPTGVTFGYSKYASNAPTAAGECYYLVRNKKEIAQTYVSEKKLLPGDVIFMSSKKNGRYKNVTHVGIYIGNDIIIHASPRNTNDVQYGTYSYYKNMVVSIGRPV